VWSEMVRSSVGRRHRYCGDSYGRDQEVFREIAGPSDAAPIMLGVMKYTKNGSEDPRK